MRQVIDGCILKHEENLNKVMYIWPETEARVNKTVMDKLIGRFKSKPFYAFVMLVKNRDLLAFLQETYGFRNNVLWCEDEKRFPYNDVMTLFPAYAKQPVIDDPYGNKIIVPNDNFNPVAISIPIGCLQGVNLFLQPPDIYPEHKVLNPYWDVARSYAEVVDNRVPEHVAKALYAGGEMILYTDGNRRYVRRFDTFGELSVNPYTQAVRISNYKNDVKLEGITSLINDVPSLGTDFVPVSLNDSFVFDSRWLAACSMFEFKLGKKSYVCVDNHVYTIEDKSLTGRTPIRSLIGYGKDGYVTDIYKYKGRVEGAN